MEENHDRGSNMMTGEARERVQVLPSMTKGDIVGQKLRLSLMSIIDDHGQSQGSPKMGPTIVDTIPWVSLELPQIAWKAINKNTNRCCKSVVVVMEWSRWLRII